jgi:hypothetical protein
MGFGGPGQEGRGRGDWGFSEKDPEMSKLNIGCLEGGQQKEKRTGIEQNVEMESTAGRDRENCDKRKTKTAEKQSIQKELKKKRKIKTNFGFVSSPCG